MTTTDTTPVPLTDTHAAGKDAGHPDRHEHSWSTESRHRTSAGDVLYVRCATCGARRVDRQDRLETPPVPLSRAIAGS